MSGLDYAEDPSSPGSSPASLASLASAAAAAADDDDDDVSIPNSSTDTTPTKQKTTKRSFRGPVQKSTEQKREDLRELLELLQKRRLARISGGYSDSDADDYGSGAFNVEIDSSVSSFFMAPIYSVGRMVRGAYNFFSGVDESEFSSSSASASSSSLNPSDVSKRMMGFDETKVRRAVELRGKLNQSLARRLPDHVSVGAKRIFVGTWNVAKAQPPPAEAMKVWLSGNIKGGGGGSSGSGGLAASASSSDAAAAAAAAAACRLTPSDIPSVAVIGLQEAAMDGMSLILETTEAVAEWSEAFQSALHLLTKEAGKPTMFRKLRSVQLVGLIMLIYVPHTEMDDVRNLRVAVTRTGPLSVTGNKGAVGCRFTFHGKRLLFICGHFAPHEHNVSVRDHHFHSALDRLELEVPDGADDLTDYVFRLRSDTSVYDSMSDDARVRGANLVSRLFQRREFRKLKNSTERSRLLLGSHDYTFFFGDLNYRLVRSAQPAMIKDLMSRGRVAQLLQYDELSLGVKKGFIFQGFVEPPVQFQPTYKMRPESDAYDMTKRKPAWTDRILVHALHGEVDTESVMVDRNEAALLEQRASGHLGGSEESVVFLDIDDSRGQMDPNSLSNGSFGSSDIFGGSVGLRRKLSSDSLSAGLSPANNNSRGNNTHNGMSRPATPTVGASPSAASAASASPAGGSVSNSGTSNSNDQTDSLTSGGGGGGGDGGFQSGGSTPAHGAAAAAAANENGGGGAAMLPKTSASFEDFLRTMTGDGMLDTVENKVETYWYCSIPSLKSSDHRPVSASFDINVPVLSKAARDELVFDSKQELGIDLLDKIKYAF